MSKNGKESPLNQTEAASGGDARVARSISGEAGEAYRYRASMDQAGNGGGFKGRTSPRRPVPRARRMSLSLTHLDAWSVAKVTFLLSVAGGIIQVIAVALLWVLLSVVGVFDQVTQIFSSTGLSTGSFNLASIFSLSTVLSAVTIVSIVEVVVATLLSVIIAALYNVVSQLVGGVHVTLGDD
ncbi:Transmembrane protein of unknown function [Bifidobacterium bohemicum]|uniref:Putative integral membrane protein n=1 Tax=Bifidobacterium bohemicum DSM 22767 TaxID=1437606 RepID=A0A086ZE19_9BIFI|nr:DUF3566 domain-containing protein [Bifidobacterium bohemicum]KFI44769.1 putative integral membrane protein [Bifidobacterium bohemicum DSM 22767]SCC19318.1 Transmembrane protein of unknown function [Bifidobacterium bohemicum]